MLIIQIDFLRTNNAHLVFYFVSEINMIQYGKHHFNFRVLTI